MPLTPTERQQRHRKRYPGKYRARTAVNNAVRDGRLMREPCQDCGGAERVEAHHKDYRKPLDVDWLCKPCHRRHDKEKKKK